MRKIRQLVKSQVGSILEYVLVAALVGVAAFGILQTTGSKIRDIYGAVVSVMTGGESTEISAGTVDKSASVKFGGGSEGGAP